MSSSPTTGLQRSQLSLLATSTLKTNSKMECLLSSLWVFHFYLFGPGLLGQHLAHVLCGMIRPKRVLALWLVLLSFAWSCRLSSRFDRNFGPQNREEKSRCFIRTTVQWVLSWVIELCLRPLCREAKGFPLLCGIRSLEVRCWVGGGLAVFDAQPNNIDG